MEKLMKFVTDKQAKTKFDDLLNLAQDGDITIKKNGEPVAVLVSYDEYLCYEELAEEISMLEYLVADEAEKGTDTGDKEIKEFLHIE